MKVAVISHAGIKSVNRAVYRYIAREKDCQLTLFIPTRIGDGSTRALVADPILPEDPNTVALELLGINPRTYYYPDLISHLDHFKPQVVLLENDPVSKLGMSLARWCRKNHAKLICQTYENFSRKLSSTIKMQGWKAVPTNLLIHWTNLWMTRKVDALLVVNRDSEQIFKDLGYKRVTRIPLGYDPNIFYLDNERRKQYRAKLNLSPETVVIAYFGRMVRQKGVHLLIQALAQFEGNWMLLLDRFHDGEEQYASYLRSLLKENQLEDKVIFFDANHVEIADYMRAADIMVAPSITTRQFKEQYGRAVQEAMACGCVSLVSDSGHLKDLVGNAEVVFPEGNVERMRELLTLFVTDEQRRKDMSSKQALRAKTLLTTVRQAEEVFSLVNTL